MTVPQQRGTLIKWKDDRGFGFIQPDQGKQEVFLHISALPQGSRRPQEGDTIFYNISMAEKGKVRASQARLAGVSSLSPVESTQPRHSPRRTKPKAVNNNRFLNKLKVLGFAFAVVSGLGGFELMRSQATRTPSVANTSPVADSQPTASSDCNIKGNISHNTQKKLYHTPGMEDYEITKISPEYGEMWFCTEADAKAAGWTKAPN